MAKRRFLKRRLKESDKRIIELETEVKNLKASNKILRDKLSNGKNIENILHALYNFSAKFVDLDEDTAKAVKEYESIFCNVIGTMM